MSNQDLINVDSVVTRFGENAVHDGISFTVQRGLVFALIGGSGSGKSVLLKEILGLQKPDSGTLSVFGENIVKSTEEQLQKIRSRIGVLFQNGALFSAINAAENIGVPLREQSDLPESLIETITNLRLQFTGLSPDTADKMPSELSGGMRKRVALARALALEPELLFLDEPTSGLDPINARAMDKLIRTLCDNLGLTVFIVTHDLDTLWGIVDQVVVLGEGKIIAQGTVEEISKSNNQWVQDYFSSVAISRDKQNKDKNKTLKV